MAKYRPIYIKIWNDPDFEEYPPEGKLIFIYLCTNPNATESGIYPISCKSIAGDTGIDIPRVKELLANGLKNVLYDEATRHVFVRNFHRYNAGGSPKLIETSILNDFSHSQETYLWNDFLVTYQEFNGKITPLVPNPKCNPISKPNPNRTVCKRLAKGFQTAVVPGNSFATFWEAYPRKVGKQDAQKAFAKVSPDETLLAVMLAAIEKAKQTEGWQKEKGKYIPHPATWLNGKRWDDEIGEPRQGLADTRFPSHYPSVEELQRG
jgi:hypothetical protein